MAGKSNPKREGFFTERVKPTVDPDWDGRDKFLRALNNVERELKRHMWRGIERCQLCPVSKSIAEYALDDWEWSGFYNHYIDAHDVRPSPEFIAFIEKEYAKYHG